MRSDVSDAHLDHKTLNQIADGDPTARSAASVRAHLRSCAACRGEIQFIRSLSSAIRSLPTPQPPAQLIDDLFPRERDRGNVLAFPLHWARNARSSRFRASSLTALVLLALSAGALFLTIGSDRALAGASTLELERISTGALTLRYETVSPLAAEAALRARIRYWIPDSLRFAQTAPGFKAVGLSREGHGQFEGVADLPPGTVYAIAAIEDLDGAYIDSGYGRFWEYLETDAEGHPTLQARRYQLMAALEFNASGAAAVAQLAASEFPGQPEFWFWLLSYELTVVSGAPSKISQSIRVERLDELDRAAREGQPGPVEIDALSRYARLLGRTDLADYWWSELRERYPRHGAAALANLQKVLLSGAATEEKLEVLEADWVRVGAPATARLGLRYSYELADPVLTEKWLGRYEAISWTRGLSSDTEAARSLMQTRALWPLAERWIRDQLSNRRDWDWIGRVRPLHQSRYNFEAERRQSRAHLYLYLSRIRIDRGDPAGGIDALERSVEETWDPRVFVSAAEIHRSLGSDVRAAQLLALAQVDPVTPLDRYPSTEDDVERTPADAQLAAARAAMKERIMAGLLDEYVNLNVALHAATGEEMTLEQAAGPGAGVTLVLHAIRPDLVPNEAFALLTQLTERLDSAGVRTVFVSAQQDPSSSETPRTEFRFHYDPDRKVWNELRAWRSVQYFVLDRGGRLRHRGEDLEAALRITLVLSP